MCFSWVNGSLADVLSVFRTTFGDVSVFDGSLTDFVVVWRKKIKRIEKSNYLEVHTDENQMRAEHDERLGEEVTYNYVQFTKVSCDSSVKITITPAFDPF